MNPKSSEYLISKYPDLAGSHPVEKAVKRSVASGEKGPNTKADRVDRYLARLEAITKQKSAETPAGHGELFAPALNSERDKETKAVHPERNAQYLKDLILKQYCLDTTDEATVTAVAQGLFESEKRLAIEQGRGQDVKKLEQTHPDEITKLYRNAVFEKSNIQKKTLTDWLEYLNQNDASYPMWFQYMVVRELGKMGSLDKEHYTYARRTGKTVAPFPELNSEALGWVFARITDKQGESVPSDWYVPRTPEVATHRDILVKALQKKDFVSLYALAQVETAGKLNKESIEGEWKKYTKGSNPKTLEKDLKGKGTGWCTAEGSASAHLQSGDFYVYYTKTDSGYTQPRIAIRMEQNTVAEVRGVDKRQALEPELVDIARDQFKNLPGGDKYEKKSDDMKQLTTISKLYNTETKQWNRPLTKQELTFLYELDSQIEGFGYDKDPRIIELIQTRKDPHLLKQDMATLFDCEPNQIATTREQLLQNTEQGIQTKAYIGPIHNIPNFFETTSANIEHIYTSFPEGRIRKEQISFGGKTADQLEATIKQLGFEIYGYAKDMMYHKDFTTSKTETKNTFIRLTVRDLFGDNNSHTTDQIYTKANQLGLDLCPAEVGPHYRIQYTNQPMYEYVYIAMKPILVPDGSPSVFGVHRGGHGTRLDGLWTDPTDLWGAGSGIVFSLRK